MRRISLDLGWPAFMCLDDHAIGAPAERHRRGEVAGDAWDDVLWRGDVGDDFFDRPPYTSRKARQRQRRAQERDHLPARYPRGQLGGALREFAFEKTAGFGA